MTRDCFDVTLLRNGSHDPTTRVFTSERNGGSKNHIVTRIERATLTPDGPGAVSIAVSLKAITTLRLGAQVVPGSPTVQGVSAPDTRSPSH
jgi:hypothetical protein